MTKLDAFQTIVARTLMGLAVVHVPILALIAAALGQDMLAPVLIAAIVAAVPMILWHLRRPTAVVAFALSVALVGQTSILVALFAGHPWQIEMHFYYFAVLAMLSGFCDWRVMVAAAGLVAAHHLSLNFILPALLYSGGTDLSRMLVHALVVVIEAVMLVGIGFTIRGAFAQADGARREAEQAAVEVRQAGETREAQFTATTARAVRMSELLEKFQREMVDSTGILHAAAEAVQFDAQGLARATTHANAQSIMASAASEHTGAKVQSAAHAGEELAATVSEVGFNAAQSSELAARAVDKAAKTSAAIDELALAGNEISKVTELIRGIANQTNLLALNATIEAARAGDTGRGFAIVAQEVKALAGQTASATEEIGRRIEAMQNATGRSVEAIGSISATIRELDEFSARIAAAVEQQAAAAHAIAGNAGAAAASVSQVNGAIAEIESVMQQTDSAAGKLGSAAFNVADQAKRIRDQVSALTENIRAISA